MTTEQIELFASDIALPAGLHPAKQAQLDGLHATARMDLAEARRAPEWEAAKYQATKLAKLGEPENGPIGLMSHPQADTVAPVAHRWQFVKDVAGIRRDLTRSAHVTDWKTEALYLAHYLDGNTNNHAKAVTAANMLGIYHQFGIDWQGLRSTGTAQT